jgi:hypothetical protein
VGRDSSALEFSRATRPHSFLDGAAMTLWPNKSLETTPVERLGLFVEVFGFFIVLVPGCLSLIVRPHEHDRIMNNPRSNIPEDADPWLGVTEVLHKLATIGWVKQAGLTNKFADIELTGLGISGFTHLAELNKKVGGFVGREPHALFFLAKWFQEHPPFRE